MLTIFWVSTSLLLLCAFIFILPWVKSWRFGLSIALFVGLTTYGLYSKLGYGSYLKHYYSEDEQILRSKQDDFRELLAEFRKQEFRLKLRLEENPNDLDAEWRLLDLLSIKALQHGDITLAKDYWDKALLKMPEQYRAQFKARIARISPQK